MSCPDCFRGGKATGEPKGTMEMLHGVNTYVAQPPNGVSLPSTVIFYTDIFGLQLVNNKILADDYALNTGFRVLVPDIIPGGSVHPDVITLMDRILEPPPGIGGQLSRVWSLLKALPTVVPFMLRARPNKPICQDASLDYARKVKAALPAGGKLGVAGFCWGGYQTIYLAAQPSVAGGTEPLVDAQFTAHPSALELPNQVIDAVMKFKVPNAIAHAANDVQLKTDKVDETHAALKQKVGDGKGQDGYYYEFVTYPGAAHGFSVRARPGNEADATAADEAKAQAVAWFKKFL